MSHPILRRSLLVVLVTLVALVASSAAPVASTPAQGSNEFVLKPPPFVSIAQAQESSAPFPQDEAGISAYFRAPFPITIASVHDAFRTIEHEDSNYIIGSVAVPDYEGESEDVHVYVHRDGWFLAYYLASDPAGKIIDWRLYDSTGRTTFSTKLESALSVVALPAGVTPNGISFYDFRNPNANRLIMIADWTEGTDTFQVNLPNDFTYLERSWSFGTTRHGRLKLNGQQLFGSTTFGWLTTQGLLTVLQLPQSQYHTLQVEHDTYYTTSSYGGLVLIYRVP